MADSLRIGVIGCGGIAQIMHLPHVVETPGLTLHSIADTNPTVLSAVGDRYGVVKRFQSWRDMLADDALDAVVICHTGSHRDSVIDALNAGKHVLVEKPLAWNVREAREVAAVAAQSDRVVQIGYHKLHDPAFAYAKRELAAFADIAFVDCTVLHAADEFNRAPYAVVGADGQIAQFNYDLPEWGAMQTGIAQWLASGPTAALTDEGLGDHAGIVSLQVAFGLLTVSVIHQIYVLFGLLGEPVRVLHTDVWRQGMSISTLIEFPNDVRCTLNWHNLPYLNDYRETYALFGNRQRLRLEFPGPYYRNLPTPVVVQGGDGELAWEKRVTVSYREAFHNELLAFARAVRTGERAPGSVDDAVRHAQFIEDILRAVPRS